ncbi:Chromosome transmission fidelity protein 18 [Hypsizygus marmoreus]|uniref:Chromosome transmission fidelity protein 18 n=1 Tax=Hypsizygus marmoreus TaxID=39966 RepID=A0A369JJH8_HYPMA|nr:Chromosome transmission fidelity protein 18 [Hypsizygus marmoreus]
MSSVLLSSVRVQDSTDLPSESPTMFIPNGLLGPTPLLCKPDDNVASFAASETGIFVPNGLLGHSEDVGCGLDSGLGASAGEPHQFISNGLLSHTSTEAMLPVVDTFFTPNGLLSSTQETSDDLPPVFEAFGVPSGLLVTTLPPPELVTSSSSSSTSRFSIRATTFDGKVVNLKRKPKVSHIARNRISPNYSTQRMGNLLDVPIHRLMDDLSTATAARLRLIEQTSTRVSRATEAIEDTLWVDRYRPRKFTELMGNERVAREMMAWVKQWDWCVFGNKKGKKRPRDGDEHYNADDQYHRPREKLLLLSGPPGLGKTTMAHVVARQAGYEVMEINASDARSGSIVDDRIQPALESGFAVGSAKPVLLVIDEIDGATGVGDNSSSFIHKLVQLTYDRPRKKHRSGQSRDPNAKRPILRPIICICNDINASSLAKLKPHAFQIRLQRPADIHTVKRLREVCELEGLKADSRALSTLVGVAKGDLRGCLNTLQFIKCRSEEVTETIIRSATTGMKEAETSLNTVLNNLFNPLTRKRVKELAMGEEEEGRFVSRLSREIEASGRESSIALGCFGHYTTLRQHDANFSRYEQANEWLVTFDILSSGMYTNGDFALSPYLPYTLVPFYPLFQERGGQRVERNQADWENLQLIRANEEVLKSLSRCLRKASTHLSGDFRHLLSAPVLQLEFVPFINRIISPPLRPVNSQIIRPEEKALLTRLVGIMVSLELRFFQERAEDGQLSYRLDPPIDVFVTYDGKRAADITVSRYAVRHLVAGEIDTLLVARDADVVDKGKRGKHDFFGSTRSSKKPEDADNLDASNKLPNSESGHPRKRAKADNVDIADKPPTDFFGRVITVPSSSSTKAAVRKNVEKKYRVTYRFTEGNSAAVRKPVKVGAFL